MEVVDVVQKCVNLIEAIYYAQQETRAYRTHNHGISIMICKLWPTILEAQQRNPSLCHAPKAEQMLLEVFEALKRELEAALTVLSKSCAMTQFDKLLEQGQTKRTLTMIRENLFMRAREAYLFTVHTCPPRGRRLSIPASSSERPAESPSPVSSEDGVARIYFADDQ